MIDGNIKQQMANIIENEGHILYGINYFSQDGDSIMQVQMINKDNPLNMDECVRLTKLITPLLDKYNICDKYRVEIGSAGVIKEITEKKQYSLCVGEKVKINLQDRSIKGMLMEALSDSILIDETKVLIKDIIKAKTIL